MKINIIIPILLIVLVGCTKNPDKVEDIISNNTESNVSLNTELIDTAGSQSIKEQNNNIDEKTVKTGESLKVEQTNKKEPIIKEGNNLDLPLGFPSIIPIPKNANITNTYDDGEALSVIYQTSKDFDKVIGIYKNLMKSSELIMEDSIGDSYYTINGTKNGINIYIVVAAFNRGTMVTINTNTFDLTAVKEGQEMREEWVNIPNEADFTPLFLQEPGPPPDEHIMVTNQTIKTVIDDIVIKVYVNEEPKDFDAIPNDVIFKQKIMPNDDKSPYYDGDIIPVILDVIEAENIETELIIKGMVEFKGRRFSLAENIFIVDLPPEGTYRPNSDKVKYQVYIPHTGDEYWFAMWDSRQIVSYNPRKYIIQSEGLDKLVDN